MSHRRSDRSTDPATPDPLRAIVDGAATLNDWAGERTGLDFADERGWLADDDRARLRELEARFPALAAELAERWRHLPPDAIAAHDARVDAALARLREAGGQLNHFYLSDLEARARATASPQRRFDFWAIWAVHRI